MASPLNWFRRNAIWIMVPVGIFCMAFFGLGAVFEQFATDIRTGGTRENPVLATWKNGTYTRNQISKWTQRHFGMSRLLRGLEEYGRSEREDEYVSLVMPLTPIQDGQQDYIDEQVISRHLMAEKAREEGLLVSDAMITDYLSMSAGGATVTPQVIKDVNREVNGGRVPMAAIRQQMEVELLSQKMMLLSNSGLPRVPNLTESVEHFGKTARKIECQVIPVSVSDYVDDSLSPTQSELRAIYEDGKLEFRDPSGEMPGFKMPRRLKMQYFAANFESFLTKVSADLTDKEIQAQYDELVEQESDLVMEIIPGEELDDTPAVETGNDDAAKESDAQSADESDDPAPVPSTETPDNSINVTGTRKFHFVSTRAQEGQEEAEGGSEGDAEVPQADADNEATDTSESVETTTTETATTETKTTETETPEVKSEAAPAGADGDSLKQESAEGNPADEDSDNEAGGLVDMLNSADKSDQSDDDDAAIGPLLGDEEEKVVKRAKPLKEVADVIRRQLKGADATEAMRVALVTAETQVETYNQQLLLWDNSTEKPKPEAPDFQAIADNNGLRLGETELVNNDELRETELGKTLNFTQRSVDRLADIIFDRYNTTDVYAPTTYSDPTKAFVYWATEKRDTEVPALADCKDKVVSFWRQQKAFEKATEAAQAIAAKAGADKALTDIDPDKAGPTGEFSWFQARGRRTQFSSPIGVELAGEAFMEMAFSLQQGEAGVAPNTRRDIVYVIQATKAAQSVADYGGEYLKDHLFKFQRMPADVGMVNAHYYSEKQKDWNREYVDSMNFDFMK